MYYIETKKRVNSKKYSKVKELPEISDVINYMAEKKIVATGTPYFFTHINLSDGSIVSQEYMGLLTSPMKLKEKMIDLCILEGGK